MACLFTTDFISDSKKEHALQHQMSRRTYSAYDIHYIIHYSANSGCELISKHKLNNSNHSSTYSHAESVYMGIGIARVSFCHVITLSMYISE